MLIFEKRLTLNDANDRENVYFEFEVPEGVKTLAIDYEYGPKTVEDEEKARRIIEEKLNEYGNEGDVGAYLPIKNLITLSLDREGKYIGAAHRQDAKQHIEINEGAASPGFNPCPAEGKWRLSLNAHCCMAEVHAHITVKGVL